MSRFTKFALLTLAAFVFTGLLTAPVFAAPPLKVSVPLEKSYYLTTDTFTGSNTLEACADGYHFASIYELWNVSELAYNTELGQTTADSGEGPPAMVFGFYRSGTDESDGSYNCEVWTNDTGGMGLIARFRDFLEFANPDPANNPMDFGWKGSCSGSWPVWCISDAVY